MDRELKFRAWDGKNMIFFSDMTIGIERRYNKPYVFFKTDTFGGEVSLRKHEVMQYSGVNDDTGEELFEGDIFTNDAATWEVVFDRGCFCGKMVASQSETHLALRGIMGKRKTGNIYENPELLK